MKVLSAELARTVFDSEQLPSDGLPQLAFIGRSNVGKSSLLNKLLGRKGLARTSSTPGRTRSINFFVVNRRFYFVDLPGFGYARASKQDRQSWADLIGRYFERTARAGQCRLAVVQLVDAKVGATPLDVEAADYVAGLGLPRIVVATKIDRLRRSERERSLRDVGEQLGLAGNERALPVSAETGDGLKEVWRAIESVLVPSAGAQ